MVLLCVDPELGGNCCISRALNWKTYVPPGIRKFDGKPSCTVYAVFAGISDDRGVRAAAASPDSLIVLQLQKVETASDVERTEADKII